MPLEKFRGILVSRHALRPSDYLMGFDVGAVTPSRSFALYGSFDFRPFKKRIQEYQGNNLFIQYIEKRYIFGLGGEYMREFSSKKKDNKGFFIGVTGAWNQGNYRGTNLKPPRGWIFIPRAGLMLTNFKKNGVIKVGYQYLNTRSEEVSGHWVFVSFSVITQ